MIVRKICRLQGCVPKRLGIRCALVLLFPVCSVSSLCSTPIVHWIPSRYRQIADRLVCFCGRRGGLWQDRPTNRVPGSYDISVGKCHQCHERWANPQSVIRAFGYTFHVVYITSESNDRFGIIRISYVWFFRYRQYRYPISSVWYEKL